MCIVESSSSSSCAFDVKLKAKRRINSKGKLNVFMSTGLKPKVRYLHSSSKGIVEQFQIGELVVLMDY